VETVQSHFKGPGTIMIQPVHKIHITEHSDMQLQHICTLTVRNCYEHLVGGPFTVLSCSQGSWSSKCKQHCWVEYDSTGGVRQLIKCPVCSCCAHGVSHENSLNNTYNNNRIFGLNILCVTGNSLSLDPWGWAWSIDYNLRSRKTSPAIFFLFSHAQIIRARKPGKMPHCQTSGDSICPCWGPCRLQNSSLGQLENMIRW